MNRELLSKALGEIDEAFIAKAYRSVPEEAASTSSERIVQMKKKHMLTFALAAALILALGVAAYAHGWFGFSSRLVPAPTPSAGMEPAPEYGNPRDHHYLSYSGAMGSNTMKASLEWYDYVEAWQESEEADNYTNDV